MPLTTLLSWAWIAHTIEVDNAVEAAATDRVARLFRISLPMWTNGLRLIPADGITVAELHQRARAACNLPGLERWGWIRIDTDAPGERDGFGTRRGLTARSVLRPTRAGAYATRLFPRVIDTTERAWRQRFGDDATEALRAALRAHVAQMPWSPPEVSPADGFFTHVLGDGTDGPDPPLVAMLGQVLTALTVEWERGAAISLPLTANVLRVLGDDTVPVRTLPERTGLSKEAVEMATGFLTRRQLAVVEAPRMIRLTAAGRETAAGHARPGAEHDDAALRAALQTLVRDTEALSAGLRPPADGWRNTKPYVAQTHRLIADPTGALPWQPMVLHRGGWPDGS